MAEPKRGSVEAFKAAEKRRQERLKKPSIKKTDAKKEAFNKKVASINKSRINQDSVSKFKAAEERRKARVASVNKINPNSPKAKRIAAKRAEADVEKDLPKSKISTATAVGTAVGTTAGKIDSPAKKVSTKTKALPKAKPDLKGAASSFGEAFKKARAQGVGTKFAYNDKMYSAVTKDDISRAGKSSLQDFLNSTKRKGTQIAKAPGQIIKKNKGGSISKSRRMSQQGERRKGVMGVGILGGTYKRPSVENAKTKMRALKDSFEDKTSPMKKERIMDAMKSKFAERRERKPSSKVFKYGGRISVKQEDIKKARIKASDEAKKRNIELKNRSVVNKQSGGMIAQRPEGRMPQISKEKRDRIRKMIASARGAAESFGSPGMRGQRIRDRFNEKASTAKGVESEDFRNLQEAKSFMDQIRKSPAQDRMKTGGSVMARGCKLGRKKPTKMY